MFPVWGGHPELLRLRVRPFAEGLLAAGTGFLWHPGTVGLSAAALL